MHRGVVSQELAESHGRTYRRGQLVHDAFREVAAGSPAECAARCGDSRLTYEELDRRSDELALLIQGMGVAPLSRIALLAERSNETLTAILAILKAGCAYVPLDPSYPAPQLAMMMQDCAPAIVICQITPPMELVPLLERHSAPALSELLAQSARAAGGVLNARVDAGDPAYVMYTSGSTGIPKGVVVPHRAVTRLVREQSYASFTSSEIFLGLAPLAFDASTLEVWGALLNGGQVAIVPQARPSLDQIAAAIARYLPTSAWFTAGLFNLLVDHKLESLRPLRQILAGGDVLSPAHVQKALAALPDCALINGYGPTENTTFSCCYRIPRDGWGPGPVPIGRPIAHTHISVVDENLQSAGEGEVGQLCLAGDGLALGYLNQAKLTADKFVADERTKGERFYLTGDLVRVRPDGNLEFLGRSDTQVKIDGKRVELGEIESRLREFPGIADAVVVARQYLGGRRLIGYVVWGGPQPGRIPDAFEFLRAGLPAHMVPAELLELDALPLNANGKVDRSALPDLPAASAGREVWLSPTQALIHDIWCDVLGLETISLKQRFFDLGGTSLRLIDAHERIQRRVGRKIDLVHFFAHPTIAELAHFLDGNLTASGALRAAQTRGGRQRVLLSRLRQISRGTVP